MSLPEESDDDLRHLIGYAFPSNENESDYSLQVCALEQCMMAYHYRGDDANFDWLAGIYQSLVPPSPDRKAPSLILPENLMARQRFPEALAANQEYWMLTASRGTTSMKAACLYQRGCIHYGLGDQDEARRCWNEALECFEDPFEPHGVAQCLERLGGLSLKTGMLAEARRLVRQAIELYKESGDEAAVCAAGGTLGDILKERGDHDQARDLYQRGLTFWQERGHPRWIERFETRLQNL
jgi:tetratricopeptide (TPR) repeat protein